MSLVDRIQLHDPLFDEKDFCFWTEMVMKNLQTAWSEKDYDRLKKYETDELFQVHQRQLKNMTEHQVKNCIENMDVKNSKIMAYQFLNEFDIIDVHIQMKLVDYYISEKDLNVVSGSKTDVKSVKYKLVFKKKKSERSKSFMYGDDSVCPHCGAPIDIHKTQVCSFCQREIRPRESYYKVEQLEILSVTP